LGLSDAEIAGWRFVAEQTTWTHVSYVFGKLGSRDRVQAGRRLGLRDRPVTPGRRGALTLRRDGDDAG